MALNSLTVRIHSLFVSTDAPSASLLRGAKLKCLSWTRFFRRSPHWLVWG